MTDSLFSYFICRTSPGTGLWSFPRAPFLSFTWSFSSSSLSLSFSQSFVPVLFMSGNQLYWIALLFVCCLGFGGLHCESEPMQPSSFLPSLWIGVSALFLFVFCLLSPLPGGWRHCVDGVIPSDTPASPAPSGHHWCIVGTAWWGQWLARTIKLGGLHKGHAHCMMGKCNGGSRCCHRGPRGGEREVETADVSLPLSSCRLAEMLCLWLFEAGKRRQQPYLLLNKWSVWAQQDGQTFVLLHYGQESLRWWWSLPLRFLKVSKIDSNFIL